MTVDEILATGQYTDRRGREWARSPHTSEFGEYWYMPIGPNERGQTHHIAYLDEMRLLIERDLHRGECRGLAHCLSHPVPRVTVWGKAFDVWSDGVLDAGDWGSDSHTALVEAMDAARALAVGE